MTDLERMTKLSLQCKEMNRYLCEQDEKIRSFSYGARRGECTDDELVAMCEENQRTGITMGVLKNNAKYFMARGCMAKLAEIIKKYDGKPLGEKTKDKIYDEFKRETGCYMYLSRDYNGKASNYLVIHNEYKVEVYANNTLQFVNKDNKIIAENFLEGNWHCRAKLVNDVEGYVNKLYELHNNLYYASKQLEKCAAEYESFRDSIDGNVKYTHTRAYVSHDIQWEII